MSDLLKEGYGIDFEKIAKWFRFHAIVIFITFIVAFSLGYYKAEASIELDCKYAKAIRVGTSAFKCDRIL